MAGLPEGDHQDIEPGQEIAEKVQRALGAGKGDQLQVPGGKDGVKLLSQEEHRPVAGQPDPHEYPHREPAHRLRPLPLSGGHKVAEDRLEPLGQPQEQGQNNQHHVPHHQIGRQSQLPEAVAGDGQVIEEGGHPDGELHHKGGHAAQQDLPHPPERGPDPGEIQRPSPPQEVGQKDEHAENRSQSGGEGRPPDAPVQGVHEQIVQHDVGHRPRHQRRHGQLGSAVVADHAPQQKAEQLKGGEGDDEPQIAGGQPQNIRRGPQKPGQGSQEQVAQRRDQQSHAS